MHGRWGTWVAESVKHPTLDFSSENDLTVMRSNSMSDSSLGVAPAWDSLSPSSSAPPFSLSLSLSLSHTHTHTKFMEANENANTTVQNLWNTAKTVLRGKCAVIQAFLKTEGVSSHLGGSIS